MNCHEEKLTITVDAELLPMAKRYARSRGVCSLRSSSSPSERWPETARHRFHRGGGVDSGPRERDDHATTRSPKLTSMMSWHRVLIHIALDRHPHSGPATELLDRIERARRARASRGIPYRTSTTSCPRRVAARMPVTSSLS